MHQGTIGGSILGAATEVQLGVVQPAELEGRELNRHQRFDRDLALCAYRLRVICFGFPFMAGSRRDMSRPSGIQACYNLT